MRIVIIIAYISLYLIIKNALMEQKRKEIEANWSHRCNNSEFKESEKETKLKAYKELAKNRNYSYLIPEIERMEKEMIN